MRCDCRQGCPRQCSWFPDRDIGTRVAAMDPTRLSPSSFSRSIYGDPAAEIDDLLQSIRDHGILVPLVVARGTDAGTWQVISGHRRLACALALGLSKRSMRDSHLFERAHHAISQSWNITVNAKRISVK